jgi:hypothetical protein
VIGVDALRWLWTVVGAIGAITSLAGLLIMVWLARDAERYDWALKQLRGSGLELARLQSAGDVRDMWILVAAMAVLLVDVAMACGAGLASFFGLSQIAISLLVGSEICTVLGALDLVALGVMKLNRRQAVVRTVKLNRKAE